MVLRIVFETHSLSTDNEAGIASGWNDVSLSTRGRALAKELGDRRRNDVLSAIVVSDLTRAVETAVIAFGNSRVPIYFDRRLRECNYGNFNGAPIDDLKGNRGRFINVPYPNGQSYQEVVLSVAAVLEELKQDWSGRLLLIGHSATRWALEVLADRHRLEDLVDAPFNWQPGWEYTLQ